MSFFAKKSMTRPTTLFGCDGRSHYEPSSRMHPTNENRLTVAFIAVAEATTPRAGTCWRRRAGWLCGRRPGCIGVRVPCSGGARGGSEGCAVAAAPELLRGRPPPPLGTWRGRTRAPGSMSSGGRRFRVTGSRDWWGRSRSCGGGGKGVTRFEGG